MKACKGILLCVIVFLLIGQGLIAQNEGSTTPEELYLSVALQLIRSQAVSEYRSSKLEAIDAIKLRYDDGRFTADEEALLRVLDSLAGEGVSNRVLAKGGVVNDFPEVRRRAVELLGLVGGSRAENIVFRVLNDEAEAMVLSEAVYALGIMQSNNPNTASYIASVMSSNNARITPDNNLAYACMLTFEKLAIADATIFGEIFNVANGRYSSTVRNKAVELVRQLRDST